MESADDSHYITASPLNGTVGTSGLNRGSIGKNSNSKQEIVHTQLHISTQYASTWGQSCKSGKICLVVVALFSGTPKNLLVVVANFSGKPLNTKNTKFSGQPLILVA